MIRACFREVEVGYLERVWRASIRRNLTRAFPVDGVSGRDRPAGEPEEFAALLVFRPADRAAVTRLLRGGDWRVTREQPAAGYPRRVYLAPLWDDLGPDALHHLELIARTARHM